MNKASLVPSFMRAHGRPVLLTFLIVLVMGIAVGLALPRRYIASTDLWLDRGPSAGGSVAPTAQAVLLARNTEMRLLTSRDLAARVVVALGLDRVAGLEQLRRGLPFNQQLAQREATSAVQQNLDVAAVDDTYAVRIRFRADKPEIAASVTNRIADLYVEDRREATASSRGRQQLAAIISQSRDAVVRADAALQAYQVATASLRSDGALTEGLSDLVVDDAKLNRAQAAARGAHARAAREAEVFAAALQLTERRQLQRAVEDDATGVAVDPQVAKKRRHLGRLMAKVRSTEARVRFLSRLRERGARRAAQRRRADAELKRLTIIASVARARNVQDEAALKREMAAEALRRSTAYVISRSSAQSARRDPAPAIIVFLAVVGAALAATLTAVGLNARQKGFVTAASVEHALGLKVLATVPELSEVRRGAAAEDRLAVPNYLLQHPTSSLAEAFKGLLLALRAERAQGEARVISVSSALPDEGKTTVALCLARAAALTGQRVVLIDCDLRRPAASRALLPDLKAGLIEVIAGDVDLSSALQPDPGSGLMVLGIGTKPHLGVSSLNLKAFKSILHQLRDRFDMIICDTPPALALSEAREAAALADTVLIAVRQRETPKDAVAIARDLLAHAGAAMGGAVLTMVRF